MKLLILHLFATTSLSSVYFQRTLKLRPDVIIR
jgi:hypothetical protein